MEGIEQLNETQLAAVNHIGGPLVVFAGAGSGKTRIITNRIAKLIQMGIKPWEILAVTFTNKASEEMRIRVQSLNKSARSCHISTFHSASTRWLREFSSELGFDSGFTIYDDSDSKSALKKIVKAHFPKEDLQTKFPEIRSFIIKAKSLGILPKDLESSSTDLKAPTGAKKIYQIYQETLFQSNAMDFHDLLLNTVILLRNNKKVRDSLGSRYKFILVDEFQDTNHTQFEIITILASYYKNLFVVGDDDQSIYSWRGARPDYILEFCERFEGAKKITLEQNYRCTQNIIKAANSVISHNKHRAVKNLFSTNDPGDLIEYIQEADGQMEAFQVVDTIKVEREQFDLDDIAVFYRTNSQSRSLEEAFHRENIPFTIFGAVEFYSRLEIKDILSYLRLAVNPSDNLSVSRVINIPPRGLGPKALETIDKTALEQDCTYLDACKILAESAVPRISNKIANFVIIIERLTSLSKTQPISDTIEWLLNESSYLTYLQKKFPDQHGDKTENIHELVASISDYEEKSENPTLDDWLQTISLVPKESDEHTRGVSLMTLHSAKGLEFNRVYIVGVEEGLIPHKNSSEKEALIEEERRLFYVGITRAKKKLSILSAYRRAQYNTYTANSPSRFIAEISSDCLKLNENAFLKNLYSNQLEIDSFDPEEPNREPVREEDLEIGDNVFHPTYGKGTIQKIELDFNMKKAIVFFREFGKRKINISQLEK